MKEEIIKIKSWEIRLTTDEKGREGATLYAIGENGTPYTFEPTVGDLYQQGDLVVIEHTPNQ